MNVRELLGKDRFARLLGIELLEVSEGKAISKMEIRDEHLNGVDIAQGGAIFTLADFTLAAAANSHGTVAVVINANINFIKAASKGMLYAKASETSRTSRIATYVVDITNTDGVLIAEYHGTAYRRGETF
ncbi:MAG TPA: PaaI family thioesterase [Bacteroidales bacterium]|nr:PaaI family thioesterase [Bacteroidales bacterium]HQP15428.1 PaaI family thioesterase [Bacteroidales bacterium]